MVGGVGTEIAQQFIPGRGMDIYYALADLLGVVGAYYAYQRSKDFIDRTLIKLGA